MIAPNVPTLAAVAHEFTVFLPELTSRLSCRFRFRGPGAREDAIAEAIGVSWQTYLAARLKSKHVTASSLAFYSGRAVSSGRRLAGSSSTDALAETALARTRMAAPVSLDSASQSGVNFYRTFGDRRWRWPVVDLVATKVDWGEFVAAMSERDRRIIELRSQGCRQKEIATDLGITPSAVCQRIRQLQRQWEARSVA